MPNKLGIDVETIHHQRLISRLDRLKTTHAVTFGGLYHEDHRFCQVHIDTDWSEAQLDGWLYNTKGVNYVGTFERRAA